MGLNENHKAWKNHCALNLGYGFASIYYAIRNPLKTGHYLGDIRILAKGSFLEWFKKGISE